MEKRSTTVERNTQRDVIALVTAGERYPSKRGGVEMPEEIAATIRLADLTMDIIIDFVDMDEHGIVFRAIQKMKKNHGEVVVMVRHTLRDWKSKASLKTYAQAVESVVKKRERSNKDVVHLKTHFLPGEMLVGFMVSAIGTTVQELLTNARMIAEEIVAPAKEIGEKNG
jgi:hypothetical protein